jgi:hypothetical protein
MRKGNVKMIKVYQIQLTDAEIAAVNNGETSPRIKAYFDRSFDGSFKAENFQYYTHVANVVTNDMEESFAAMNLWEGATVEKLGPCSSMSVGDILEMEDGSKYRCASFGFTQLENYQRD